MGLFKRNKKVRTVEHPTREDLALIDPSSGAELISQMTDAVFSELQDQIPTEVQSLFVTGLYLTTGRPIEHDGKTSMMMGQTAARLGYISRRVEVRMFESAKEYGESIEIRNIIQNAPGDTPIDKTVEAAARLSNWPPEYSQEEGETPVAMVPGIGGHIRSSLADGLLLGILEAPEVKSSAEDTPHTNELKMTWNFGFMLHAIQEIAPTESGLGAPWTVP